MRNVFVLIHLELAICEEDIISVHQPLLCIPWFIIFSSETLNSGIRSCFDGVVFKRQFVKNVLIYAFDVFLFRDFSLFLRGFHHYDYFSLWILKFTCVKSLLKVFVFDTGIICVSSTVYHIRWALTKLLHSMAIHAVSFASDVWLQSFFVLRISNNNLMNAYTSVGES